jgi:hypothetical protein
VATAGAPYTNSLVTVTGGNGGNGADATVVIAYLLYP